MKSLENYTCVDNNDYAILKAVLYYRMPWSEF